MNWYLCTISYQGMTLEQGWMLGKDDNDLVSYARTMGYSIDIEYLGKADMSSALPKIKENDNE